MLSGVLSCKFDNGVVLFYAVDELPDGVMLKWGGTTRYQKLVKGKLYLWIVTTDTSLANRGQIKLIVSHSIQTRKRNISSTWEIMCYTHVLPITSLSTAGYINLITRSVGVRPFDLYSRQQQNPIRFNNTEATQITLDHGSLSDHSDDPSIPQTTTQGDKGVAGIEQYSSGHSDHVTDEYDNNSYDDYWGFNTINSEDTSGSAGINQSGLISDKEQEDSVLDHEQDVLDTGDQSHVSTDSHGRTDTTIWASDAYLYEGEQFNSPIDYEIGVKGEDGRLVVDNPYDDPVIQRYLDDKYMEQYQDDVDEYDNNSSDDDPYADWSDSWDAWEL